MARTICFDKANFNFGKSKFAKIFGCAEGGGGADDVMVKLWAGLVPPRPSLAEMETVVVSASIGVPESTAPVVLNPFASGE